MQKLAILALCLSVLLAQAPSDHCNTDDDFNTQYASDECLVDAINSAYSISSCSSTSFTPDDGTQIGQGSKICPLTIVKDNNAGLRVKMTNNGASDAAISQLGVQVYYAGNLFYQYNVPNCAVTLPAQGAADVNYLVNIPSIAPAGNWAVKLVGEDSSAAQDFCVQIKFTIN